MPWVTPDEIAAARAMSCIEYLKRFEGSRLERAGARNEWQLKDHDSFKINEVTSAWHWKSRGIGGYNALQFLTAVDGMGFTEAVRFLNGQNPSYVPPESAAREEKPFVLPKRHVNAHQIIHYLNGRGISDVVIQYCIRQGILYESVPYHNAVFVGLDGQQRPKYAFLRGIYDGAKPFKIEQAGSDKSCPFVIPPKAASVRVAAYEAAIDAMAHMTLEGPGADKYRLSLGGISAPKEGQMRHSLKKPTALDAFLKRHPEIGEVELCLDNDFAGRWACEHLQKVLSEKYRVIPNLPDGEGMDYADMARQARDRGSRGMRPETVREPYKAADCKNKDGRGDAR